jgi:hypothetical protein
MIARIDTCGKEGLMRRIAVVASAVAALFVALPGVTTAAPANNVLPVQLTCGGETFDLVVPANGRASAGLHVGSTSVAVLMGVEGEFIVPGFSEDDLTRCTAVLPGESFTALVLITPRS